VFRSRDVLRKTVWKFTAISDRDIQITSTAEALYKVGNTTLLMSSN
jgi:hypothetical protein